jgi:hypothetical protein
VEGRFASVVLGFWVGAEVVIEGDVFSKDDNDVLDGGGGAGFVSGVVPVIISAIVIAIVPRFGGNRWNGESSCNEQRGQSGCYKFAHVASRSMRKSNDRKVVDAEGERPFNVV